MAEAAVRQRSRDGTVDPLDELADRMAAALEELMGWHRGRDDVQGHAFHGNQWTGGISGPKPTTIKGKSAKAGIHELLSSGHAFSKEELMAICGIKSDKLFSDYIAMLKNPKWAGPAGAIGIVKNVQGTYEVAGAAGKKPEAAVVELVEKAGEAVVAKQAAVPKVVQQQIDGWVKAGNWQMLKLTAASDKQPAWAAYALEVMQGMTEPSPKVAAPAPVIAAPAPDSKLSADKQYAETIAAAQANLAKVMIGHEGYKPDPIVTDIALLKFKQEKAKAMAKWVADLVRPAAPPPRKALHVHIH